MYTYKIKEVLKHATTNISDIDIEVEYNPETGKVDEIIEVYAFNRLTTGCADITDFLINVMRLDQRIDDLTDWYALYHQELQNEKELKELREEEEAA